jgi:hypothetical protein
VDGSDIDEGQPFVVVQQAVALTSGRANKEGTMFRSGLVKSACVAIALSGFSTMPAKAFVAHRGVTAVGPHGGVYHRGGTWGGHGGYGYRGGYGYHGGGYYGGYRPGYGYGAAAAVGAAALGAAAVGAAVAPHCWINPYGVRVCN